MGYTIKENSNPEWVYEKFRGDMAIYAFCPKCNFHYSIGTENNPEFIYRFCPICGEYLYGDKDTIDIIFNERDIMNYYENLDINSDYIREENPERKNMNKWISVKDRLPEDDLPKDTKRKSIKVLVCSTDGNKYSVRTLSRQRWIMSRNPIVYHPWEWSRDANNITHWMPLPEPPEEKP